MSTLTTSTTTAGPITTQPVDVFAPRVAAGMSPLDLLKIIRRRIVLIVVIWFLFIGMTVGGTYLWARYYPLFRADAFIKVDSPDPGGPFDIAGTPADQDLIDRYLRDQTVLLTSEQVLSEAINDPLLRETQWFESYETVDDALIELKEDLGAGSIYGSSFVRVSFATHHKDDCYKIVNAVVAKYFDHIRRTSTNEFRQQLTDFQDEVDSVRRQLTEKINEIGEFQKQAGIPGMTERINAVGQRLIQTVMAVVEAQEDKLTAKAIYDSYTAMGSGNMAISPETMAFVELDPRVAGQQNRLLALQEELGVRQEDFGQDHRIIKDLSSRVALVSEELQRTRSRRVEEVHNQQIEQVSRMYSAALEKEVRLRDELAEAQARQRELDENLATYDALKEQQRILEEESQRVQQHKRDLEIILNTQPGPRITLVARGVPPRERTSPRWSMNLAAGIPLGLVLGVGLAFMLEFLDTSVRTPRDVARHTSLPLLGVVPILDDEEIAIDDIEVATRTAPNSMVAECFRQIRTNLFFTSPAENQKAVLVTSPSPEDGKTAVAINLAATIAQSGRRVLLVDANFRRPALHRAFANASREGLSNILIGQRQLQDLVSSTDLPQLDVLTAGPIPPNPVELLSSRYMHELLARARETYDQIIIDAPPVLLVSDPLVLANILDGTIIICRAKSNSRGALLRTRDQLDQVRARILGVVLNAVETAPGGYYRRQYRAFYDYLSEGGEEAAQPVLTTEQPDQGREASPPKDDAESSQDEPLS